MIAAEIAMAAVVLAAIAAVLVRTFSSSPPSQPSPSPHSVSLPAGGRSHVTLRVTTGIPSLTIGVAAPGSDGTLLRVSTSASIAVPRLRADGGTVYLSATDADAVTVTLSPAVTWQLDIAGGTSRTTADLRGGRLAGIAVTKGSDVIDLTLPRPPGAVTVRLAAGASQLLLSLPAGVPVRISAHAGAHEISLDGRDHADVRDNTVFTTPGWAPGATGFDIDATAGAARIAVTTWAG